MVYSIHVIISLNDRVGIKQVITRTALYYGHLTELEVASLTFNKIFYERKCPNVKTLT